MKLSAKYPYKDVYENCLLYQDSVEYFDIGFGMFTRSVYHAKYSALQCFFTCKFQNQKTSQDISVNLWQGGDENDTI